MGIRKEYINSEIGFLPSNWTAKKLDELGQFSKGQGISKNEANGGAIPCIRYGELYTRFNNYIDQYYSFVSAEVAKTAKKLKYGDILFAGSGETKEEIGKCAAFIGDLEAYAGGDIVIFSPRDTNSLFLGYLLNSKAIVRQKASKGQGDAIVHISTRNLKDLIIPLPTAKTEQEAIANSLYDIDQLINSLERLIAKKRDIKQGAMQKLLKPREGWVIKRLADFLDYEQPTPYLVTDTEYNDNNQTPVLTAGKTFILGYTNEEHGIFRNLPVIIFDDFTTAIKYVDFPFKAKSSAMKMLVPKNDSVNLRFIYELMQQIEYPTGIGDHKRHWIGEYRYLEIAVPSSLQEQSKIATILSEMDSEIEALETRLVKYKMIKQGMMQTLLTGQIRLI